MPAPRSLIGLTLAVAGIVAACSGTSAQASVAPAATTAAADCDRRRGGH